ncbi:MAG: carbon storage regulator [Candidatus Thiodiazotropha endolucinida]|nr:carbon storage regulator [Candidatus Thiodiazotropha taylori]MCG8052652.1 carbon storage regulator [Candidatus Thiodiazotropha taylori]MCW4314473.1 carbon storage regulator [Candidatus Thiodiazotropha taylori]MCW4324086.1 carbon storage regulator [Candidatus Thiodiazotropha taylori]
MLSLTRKDGESLVFRFDDVEFTLIVSKPRSGQTRLIIDAPDDVQVFREEVLERMEGGCLEV